MKVNWIYRRLRALLTSKSFSSTPECTANLFKAVCQGNVQKCKTWLRKGADPRQICPRDNSGVVLVAMNSLQAAVWNGQPEALREMITWLQNQSYTKVDLNGSDMKTGKYSLLESAVLMNNVDVVRVLLDAGMSASEILPFARCRRSEAIISLLEDRAENMAATINSGTYV